MVVGSRGRIGRLASLCKTWELEYHLHFATDAGLLSPDDSQRRQQEIVEVRRMLIGLLKKLRAPVT
jgi:four helix bundle protein